ncbi:MAG: (Fe-S)-binding protein [bacterium]
MGSIKDTIRRNNAYYCLDCGKCTSVCLVSTVGQSPRLAVKRTLESEEQDVAGYEFFWSCLTCKACNEICPADVSYAEMTGEMREFARGFGICGECTHSGAISALERIMTGAKLKQNRMDWIPDDLRIHGKGDLLYFVGCIPYLDVFFEKLNLSLVDIGRNTIRVLNRLGIEPALMKDERCCGHDLLWTGEVESFGKLVKHNVELIKKTGAKTIVTACAECYKTLKQDYPAYSRDFKFEVVHLSELLARRLSEGKLALRDGRKSATYHDACRLGRFSGVLEEPRTLVNAIEGLEFREMGRSGKRALCCGTVSWTNCGRINKEVQLDRLEEAKSTGADFLITTCPKCQIHFKCAMDGEDRGKDVKMEMVDLATLMEKTII